MFGKFNYSAKNNWLFELCFQNLDFSDQILNVKGDFIGECPSITPDAVIGVQHGQNCNDDETYSVC